MSNLRMTLLCVLTVLDPVSGQKGLGPLQPWIQGLIAVVVFLALVGIAFAVNKFWCQEEPAPEDLTMAVGDQKEGSLAGTKGRYVSTAANFRSWEHANAYENTPGAEEKIRSTPM
ncbi:PDZK1-interacting protein 1 [Ornithorhynchus anatinus]|uniref:PDZK1-interacting protein 1 n=1 Tax=Ornithorhynchus anatinus TaxID=9258 RepID=A0A6I8NRB8_ORNAN|nr:PDZK1-interacting protein 1 [Ornithorhynchus anatinus]